MRLTLARRRWRWIAIAAAVIVLGIIVWRVYASWVGRGAPAASPVPVVVAPARQGTFVVYQSAPGTVTPMATVVVRSHVDSQLTSVRFTGGEMVKKGAVLATVDARPVAAEVALATGTLARDQALLENAQGTLGHYQALLAQQSIEAQRVSDQQSLVRQYAAAVKADQARLDTAKLELAQTTITAPIDGMVGLRRVDPGNFVGPSDAKGIATVTQLRPIDVVFGLPASVLPRIVARLRAGASIPVEAYGSGRDDVLGHGHLHGVNNEVDPATGTVKLQASFANADGALFPNQFVSVRLPVETLHDAVLVPTTAIQQGADGAFLYVVGANHTVAVAPVKVGPGDGTTSVIEHGVRPGAVVVTAGADGLRNGTLVAPDAGVVPAPAGSAAHPAPAAAPGQPSRRAAGAGA